MTATQTKFDVGGVLLDRPFKIRRLGHFGFNVGDPEAGKHFYSDLLGFYISDKAGTPEEPRGYFMRYGGDHHAFVLFRRGAPANPAMSAVAAPGNRSDITINQITWQTGSLSEVGNASRWFQEEGVPVRRTGRDMPGSNWHTYIYDPDGHVNELYYGIEQIGWDGRSKPRPMYTRGFREAPPLPQINEHQEVDDAVAEGIDIYSGYRHADDLPARYEVDGIMMARPFKITKIGPVSLFVADVEASTRFYTQNMGFQVSEETTVQGERGVFLRSNTEHHSLALFPNELRGKLGMSEHTSCLSFGVQLANYRQLRDAVDFLRDNGVRVETDVAPELHPGIDYAAHAFDPEGHCMELYYYMEQVGWDGKPRPQESRRIQQPGAWPAALEPLSDTFHGEAYLGPWA
jgi:catechol 2,3-dioxygenase-like lactoylglutathione lyase family enzyme